MTADKVCRCGCDMQWVGGVAGWRCPHCDDDERVPTKTSRR